MRSLAGRLQSRIHRGAVKEDGFVSAGTCTAVAGSSRPLIASSLPLTDLFLWCRELQTLRSICSDGGGRPYSWW